jgi:integrase
MIATGIEDGRLLRSVSKSGKVNRDTLSDWAVWSVVEQSSKQIGIEHFGAHDLRRTCAKLCRKNGGDLEQIWSRSNSCWGIPPSRPPNAISGRSRILRSQ